MHIRLLSILLRILDVIVDPIEHGALLNYKNTQVFEQHCQIIDRLCQLLNLFAPRIHLYFLLVEHLPIIPINFLHH